MKSEKSNAPFSKGDSGGFTDSGKETAPDSNPELIHEILDDIETNLKKSTNTAPVPMAL